jgi:hypothetical protein
MNSQQEDYDLTVEAFTQYLEHLSARGVLAVDGPTRLPPRLTLRLVATARAALEALGAVEPARHIAMIRGWQRFTLLVSREPLTAEAGGAVRAFAEGRAFDLVWLPDLQRAEVNRFQRLAEPYFHDGVAAVLTTGPQAGAHYAYRIAPATDDRPYPYRFSRWGDLQEWSWDRRGAGGGVDAGFAMSVATLLQALVIGALLIVVPLAMLPRETPHGGRGWRWRVPLYFGLLGLAFLFVEIAWIQQLMLFLGHPVYATAVVLAGFLVFAGLGSQASQDQTGGRGARRLALAVSAIVVLGALYVAFLPGVLAGLADLPGWLRVGVGLLTIAPLAFAMGMPFPIGLRAVAADAPGLVPWAWGVNGCASVVSAVAAPLLAMEVGFSGLVVAGLVGYFFVALLIPRASPE